MKLLKIRRYVALLAAQMQMPHSMNNFAAAKFSMYRNPQTVARFVMIQILSSITSWVGEMIATLSCAV